MRLLFFDVGFWCELESTLEPGAIKVITGWNVPKNDTAGIAHSIQLRTFVHISHLLSLLRFLTSKPLQHLQPALKYRRVIHNLSPPPAPGGANDRPPPITNHNL